MTETVTGQTISLLHHYVGDDSEAMDAIVEEVQRRLGCRIEAIGDANVELTAKTSLLTNDPPDIWDDWPGQNIYPYWKAGVLDEISDLWTDAGFSEAFFDHAQAAATIEGEYYALPTNVQRQNNLFYNITLFDEAGIDPSRIDDTETLLSALEKIETETEASGIVIPHKRPWPTFDIWDMAVLSESDADRYETIFRGGGAREHRQVVRSALESVAAMYRFSPDDAAYLDWQDGLQRFRDGDAAVFCMGDWAAGVLDNEAGFEYDTDWDSIPFPGTEGVYQVVMDALLTPTLTDNPEQARAVLREIGSAEVLEQFTRIRGALPPRRDCSMDDHSPFFQQQKQYYHESTAQVTATRGSGIRPEKRVEILTAMASFVQERNIESSTETIVTTLSE